MVRINGATIPDAKPLLRMDEASFMMDADEGHREAALNGGVHTALVGPEGSGSCTECLLGDRCSS